MDEKPPILGSWRNLYAFVLMMLAIYISLLYWFTKAFE
jgi:hypothetical protein